MGCLLLLSADFISVIVNSLQITFVCMYVFLQKVLRSSSLDPCCKKRRVNVSAEIIDSGQPAKFMQAYQGPNVLPFVKSLPIQGSVDQSTSCLI